MASFCVIFREVFFSLYINSFILREVFNLETNSFILREDFNLETDGFILREVGCILELTGL